MATDWPNAGSCVCLTSLQDGIAEACLSFLGNTSHLVLISPLPPFFFLLCCFVSFQQQYTPSLYILRNTNPRFLLTKIFLF